MTTTTKTKAERYNSGVHDGYMAGLTGSYPDEEIASISNEYSEAYLIGCSDREAGVKSDPFLGLDREGLPIKSGDIVEIKKGTVTKNLVKEAKPAGRTYKVKVHHTLTGCQAYFEHGWGDRTLIRPREASVVWPGTGGYWTEAAMHEVTKVG
jgi:hypothetical protein